MERCYQYRILYKLWSVYWKLVTVLQINRLKSMSANLRDRTKVYNGMYLVNENTNYEKLKNEVIRALKEANILFDKITNKQFN